MATRTVYSYSSNTTNGAYWFPNYDDTTAVWKSAYVDWEIKPNKTIARCKYCGVKHDEDDKFCDGCGSPV